MFLVSQIDNNRSIKSLSDANGTFSKPTPAESLFNHRPTALGFASAAITFKSGFVCKHFNIPAAPGAPAPVIKTLIPPVPLKEELRSKFSLSLLINGIRGKNNLSTNCHHTTAIIAFYIQGHIRPVSYTHLRAHETPEHLVCR